MDCTPWENKYLGEGEEFAEEHFSNSSFFFHPLIYKPLIYKLWMNSSLQQQEATALGNPRASGGAWRQGCLLAGKFTAGAPCNQSC